MTPLESLSSMMDASLKVSFECVDGVYSFKFSSRKYNVISSWAGDIIQFKKDYLVGKRLMGSAAILYLDALENGSRQLYDDLINPIYVVLISDNPKAIRRIKDYRILDYPQAPENGTWELKKIFDLAVLAMNGNYGEKFKENQEILRKYDKRLKGLHKKATFSEYFEILSQKDTVALADWLNRNIKNQSISGHERVPEEYSFEITGLVKLARYAGLEFEFNHPTAPPELAEIRPLDYYPNEQETLQLLVQYRNSLKLPEPPEKESFWEKLKKMV